MFDLDKIADQLANRAVNNKFEKEAAISDGLLKLKEAILKAKQSAGESAGRAGHAIKGVWQNRNATMSNAGNYIKDTWNNNDVLRSGTVAGLGGAGAMGLYSLLRGSDTPLQNMLMGGALAGIAGAGIPLIGRQVKTLGGDDKPPNNPPGGRVRDVSYPQTQKLPDKATSQLKMVPIALKEKAEETGAGLVDRLRSGNDNTAKLIAAGLVGAPIVNGIRNRNAPTRAAAISLLTGHPSVSVNNVGTHFLDETSRSLGGARNPASIVSELLGHRARTGVANLMRHPAYLAERARLSEALNRLPAGVEHYTLREGVQKEIMTLDNAVREAAALANKGRAAFAGAGTQKSLESTKNLKLRLGKRDYLKSGIKGTAAALLLDTLLNQNWGKTREGFDQEVKPVLGSWAGSIRDRLGY